MGNYCFRKRHGQDLAISLSVYPVTSLIPQANLPEPYTQDTKISWKLGEQIAEGKFCKIHECINTKTGELLILKSYQTSRSSSNFIHELKKIKKEASILKILQHENIIELYQIETSNDCLNLLMECIPGGCLEEILNKYGGLEEEIVIHYLKQLCQVLSYLNSKNISHNNLNCQSVYITSEGIVKLAGFKNFTYVDNSEDVITSKVQELHQFLAPEVLNGKVCENSDVWTLGLLSIHMITGKLPLDKLEKDQKSLIKNLTNLDSEIIFSGCSQKLTNFLKACLKIDYSERARIEDLLKFELVTGKRKKVNLHESLKASLSRTADFQSVIPELDSE